jgi:hypothetical protein
VTVVLVAVWAATAAVLAVLAARRMLLAAASFAPVSRKEPVSGPAPAASAPPVRWWVVGAVHDAAARVEALCATVRGLAGPGVSVLLVDDASTDGTGTRLREEAGADWCLYATDHPVGKAAAISRAVRTVPLAPGDLVLVLDADHELAPSAMDRLARWFGDPAVWAVAFHHRPHAMDRSLVALYCGLEAAVTEEVTGRGRAALGLSAGLAGVFACRAGVLLAHYPDTPMELGDDALLSARITAVGGRVAYATDVVSWQEVPGTVRAYLRQHIRWAAGLYRAGRSAAPRLARSRVTGRLARLEGVLAAGGYLERPVALGWAAATLGLALSGHNHPVLYAPVALSLLAVAGQLAAGLAHVRAPLRAWLRTPAALLLVAPLDVVAAVLGAAPPVVSRIGWTSAYRSEPAGAPRGHDRQRTS